MRKGAVVAKVRWDSKNLLNRFATATRSAVSQTMRAVLKDAKKNLMSTRNHATRRINKNLYSKTWFYNNLKVRGITSLGRNRLAIAWERGGKVRGKANSALAIPVSAAARAKERKGPAAFEQELRLIQRPGKPALLVRDRQVGGSRNKRGITEIMYVLLRSVQLKAKPFLKPAFNSHKHEVLPRFKAIWAAMESRMRDTFRRAA